MNRLMKTATTAIALLLALPACAQQARDSSPTDADPALWVVKDADTTIYLFGTIHVLKPGLSWFDEGVKKAFDASQTLVLEMVEPDAATQQRVVMAKAFDPAGTPLTQALPPNYRGAFATAMGQGNVPAAAYDKMRPWFAAVTLSLLPIQKLGYDPANGPEAVLTKAARVRGAAGHLRRHLARRTAPAAGKHPRRTAKGGNHVRDDGVRLGEGQPRRRGRGNERIAQGFARGRQDAADRPQQALGGVDRGADEAAGHRLHRGRRGASGGRPERAGAAGRVQAECGACELLTRRPADLAFPARCR
jgi:TraB/PrgY/gumN family